MQKIKGLSFFCPAYYDEENISFVVNRAQEVLSEVCEDFEIIVINDGSPDNTGEVLNKLASQNNRLKVIHHPRNMGYARALKTGFEHAKKFEYILFTDGDNQYDVGYLKDMLDFIEKYDAIITYRVKNANNFVRRIISWFFNRMLNLMFNEPFRDLSSAFRLVRKDAIDSIELNTTSIFLPVEIVLKLFKKNFKIKEIPMKTRKRIHGRSTSLLPKNFIGVIIDMIKLRMGYL